MNPETRLSYSDKQTLPYYANALKESKRESLPTSECFALTPRILAFMGASGSGKDLALEILTSLPGRKGISKKLELASPVNVRIVPKVTDRAPRIIEVSKIPVSEEEFTQLDQAGELIGQYTLASNGRRYAYRAQDFARSCQEEFVVAEPSILHIIELKERFGDQIHCTFLASSRSYRERLLEKRGTENAREIESRLDEGDGQTFIALYLAGKPVEFIGQFVSPDIMTHFEKLMVSEPAAWPTMPEYVELSKKIGPDLIGILANMPSNKGRVVDDLINIDRFQTFVDDVVILEDKFITDNPYQVGLFSESVIDTATRMLLNSEAHVHSVDQTADSSIICNLVVPEASRAIDDIFGLPYKRIFDAIGANQEDRRLIMPLEGREKPVEVRWISYYEDKEHVFGLIVEDPELPESVASFVVVKPDDTDEALIEFQIQMPHVRRQTDRHNAQMAFMVKSLKLCESLGVKKFHFAEHFDLVDSEDTVIGIVPRAVAHESSRFIHRAASVLLWRRRFDEEKGEHVKQIYMVKRSKNKKLNANLWQAAPSGHVLPGESYAEAARREMREELGSTFTGRVKVIHPLLPVKAYSADGGQHPQREHFYFFAAEVDEETSNLVIPSYESDVAAWIDVDEVRSMMEKDPSQFREAFRTAFTAVDWSDSVSVRKNNASTLRSALMSKTH